MLETEPLLQGAALALSAKRIAGGPGVDGWYPYYAGFSYAFARSVLASRVSAPNSVVLDPWNGSGTATAAALHLGHIPLGYDLNPATVVIARAKLATRPELRRLLSRTDACLKKAHHKLIAQPAPNDALLAWLPARATAFVRAALAAVQQEERVTTSAQLSPEGALATICILNGARHFSIDRARSNATWLHPRPVEQRLALRVLHAQIVKHAARIADDACLGLGKRLRGWTASLGDARALPTRDESVDVVLSSPPYCTRIDYAKQTSFELAALEAVEEPNLRILREQLMGTTAIRNDSQSQVALPLGAETLLKQIAEHPSHGSRAYYSKNFRQYFEDAARATKEIARVLKPKGEAILVLQNSYYKEIAIDLSSIFCDMATSAGLHASVVVRRPVNRAMATINTRSRVYGAERKYSEDVIVLRKGPHGPSRKIAAPVHRRQSRS